MEIKGGLPQKMWLNLSKLREQIQDAIDGKQDFTQGLNPVKIKNFCDSTFGSGPVRAEVTVTSIEKNGLATCSVHARGVYPDVVVIPASCLAAIKEVFKDDAPPVDQLARLAQIKQAAQAAVT